MLIAKGIVKQYGTLSVLSGIDIEVKPSEFVAIVGSSGAGKSTLLHILGTLDKADQGELRILDHNISKLKDKALADFRNQHIGFVFQFHNLLPEFSAIENICMPALIGKRNPAATEKKALELLELLNLVNRKDHKPSELSGGEQQRIAVARALINEPSIIFADEPSGNLDAKNADELHNLFFDLRERFKQTFVVVTHNPELADRADRKIELQAGKVL
ncbi:MAG: ABC transporter ATP-binding protein [Bernardetiaceae bacterium]|nr:ABC transporter ATP-binding protein [Bernardetiaceae bacterium]